MILHFVRHDLRSNRVNLLFFGITTALLLLFVSDAEDKYLYSGSLLLMLGFAIDRQIQGVRYRSQNSMSRYYLLALPIRRESMFGYIFLRGLLFLVPLFLLLMTAPWAIAKLSRFSTAPWYFEFMVTNLAAIMAMKVILMDSHFRTEINSARTDRTIRFAYAVLNFAIFGGLASAVVASYALFVISTKSPSWLPISVSAAIGIPMFFIARRNWIGK